MGSTVPGPPVEFAEGYLSAKLPLRRQTQGSIKNVKHHLSHPANLPRARVRRQISPRFKLETLGDRAIQKLDGQLGKVGWQMIVSQLPTWWQAPAISILPTRTC